MPSSCRSSSSSRNSATESMPPETVTPTRSPAFSRSCRRMWESTRSASGCTAVWYRRTAAGASRSPSRDARRVALAGQPRAAVATKPTRPDSSPAISFLDLLDKLRRSHVLGLFFPSRAHIHPPRLGFFISHHQKEWYLLHGVLANLAIHLFHYAHRPPPARRSPSTDPQSCWHIPHAAR